MEKPIKKYRSEYFYQLGGKVVFIVKNEIERNRGENDLLNSIVSIDGRLYTVEGVESFAVPVIKKGDRMGLLVSPV